MTNSQALKIAEAAVLEHVTARLWLQSPPNSRERAINLRQHLLAAKAAAQAIEEVMSKPKYPWKTRK